MEFEKTEFPFFYDECIKRFGEKEGKKISNIADKKLSEMKGESDYKDSEVIKFNMDYSLLPGISIYLAFKEVGFTKDKAYKNTLEIVQIAAEDFKKENQELSKTPDFYRKFKSSFKTEITENYPKEGWDIEWKQYDEHEMHFDVKRCIYMETTEKYNCPEVCPVFCEHDVIVFSGYEPSIIFKREGTIGKGQKICDFHFINGELKY